MNGFIIEASSYGDAFQLAGLQQADYVVQGRQKLIVSKRADWKACNLKRLYIEKRTSSEERAPGLTLSSISAAEVKSWSFIL